MSPFDQPLVSSQSTTNFPTEDSPGAADVAVLTSAASGLCAGDFHDRWDQLRQVADLGEAALGDLLAVLQDDHQDWESRWFAARALGNLPHSTVIPALIKTFARTTDDDLRQAVAAALTQIGPAAIATLGEQLAQPALRPMAVQALARIQHPDTIPLLLEAMDDPRSTVRATAIDALSAYGDPVTLTVIEQGLGDSAAVVRLAAIRALISLRWSKPSSEDASGLDPNNVTSWLAPLLDDPDLNVAQQAAHALGRLPLPGTAALLLQRLHIAGTPEPLQVSLVQALTWHNTATALEGLIQAWEGLEESVRLILVQGLATLAPELRPQAIAALVGWLQALPTTAVYGFLRRHLVLALGQIGTTALEPELQALLNDSDPGVQLHAEAALRQLRQ